MQGHQVKCQRKLRTPFRGAFEHCVGAQKTGLPAVGAVDRTDSAAALGLLLGHLHRLLLATLRRDGRRGWHRRRRLNRGRRARPRQHLVDLVLREAATSGKLCERLRRDVEDGRLVHHGLCLHGHRGVHHGRIPILHHRVVTLRRRVHHLRLHHVRHRRRRGHVGHRRGIHLGRRRLHNRGLSNSGGGHGGGWWIESGENCYVGGGLTC
mmetsp:Transcript_50373/g.68916  ORF Transcript_50373/g.68916 Transcript_50373/m.68916 type:complete len:209 (+) Transcript_50373:204-830(+)